MHIKAIEIDSSDLEAIKNRNDTLKKQKAFQRNTNKREIKRSKTNFSSYLTRSKINALMNSDVKSNKKK